MDDLIRHRHNVTLIPCVSIDRPYCRRKVFRCALSPRQSDLQISAPLRFKTSCYPVLVIFSLLCSAFNHVLHNYLFDCFCIVLSSVSVTDLPYDSAFRLRLLTKNN